jgi:Putative zinc-finger
MREKVRAENNKRFLYVKHIGRGDVMERECDKVRRKIVDFVAGELAAKAADAVKSHIDSCKDCRDEYQQTLSMVQNIKSAPLIQAPEKLYADIRRQLASEKSVQRRVSLPQLWRRPAFAAVMAMLLLGIVVVALLPGGEQTGPASSVRVEFGTTPLTFEKYVKVTNDVFRRVAVDNQTDLLKILGVPQGTMPPGWKPADDLLRGVANAMKLQEELDPAEDEFEINLLADVEKVWRRMHESADGFEKNADKIKQLIRNERILDRLEQVID